VVDSKNVEGVEVVRQPDELQKIQEIVSAAVGVNTVRGDSVVVQTMAFDRPKAEEVSPAASFLESNRPLINNAIKWTALVIVALLVLFLIVRPAKKALILAAASSGSPMMLPAGDAPVDRRQSEPAQQLAPPPTVAEVEAKMRADLEASTPPLSPEAQRSMTVRKVISDEAVQNPESVAGTLRSWLQEG
jgi:flagellar M-ring protein FliF